MSRIRSIEMDNLRGLLGIRKIGRVLNARTRELSGMTKVVYKRIDEGVLQWFGNVERMVSCKARRMVHDGVNDGNL